MATNPYFNNFKSTADQGLIEDLFIESSPIPVKWALNKVGRIPQGIRLPLTWLDNEYNSQMELILKKLGLIN